jgi:maleylacetoacetate isomerase
MTVKLYDFPRSSAAYRVRIALALKGLDWDVVPIDLGPGAETQLLPAYRSVNPQMRVPALDIGQGPVLTQSVAIIEWLEEAHPDPPLLPRDPLMRARVRATAGLIACDIHPLNNTSVKRRLAAQFGADDAAWLDWYAHWIRTGFVALEEMLPPAGSFAFGDAPGLADVMIVPQVANARRFKVPVEDFPRILAIDAACRALPAFIRAAPENQAA